MSNILKTRHKRSNKCKSLIDNKWKKFKLKTPIGMTKRTLKMRRTKRKTIMMMISEDYQ